MRIKNIKELCNSSSEAEVTITDGLYDVVCFSQPCTYIKGEIIKEPLLCWHSSQIVRGVSPCKLERLSQWSYELTGRLIDKQEGLIQVGEILIELEAGFIPGDIKNGEYISLVSSKFDI